MKKIYMAAIGLAVSLTSIIACKKNIDHSKGVLNPFIAVYAVQNVYLGSDVQMSEETLAGAHVTGGVVISNALGNNFPDGFLAIQNTFRGLTRGILIDLGSAAKNFNPGDSVTVDLNGATLGKTAGSLQLKGVSADKVKLINTGNLIKPTKVSIADLITNFSKYQSVLVELTADATPLPSSTDSYKGNKMLDDGTGRTIVFHTRDQAVFANERIYASASYIGIPVFGNEIGGYGNIPQFRIRTITDVANPSGPIYPGWPESFEQPDFTVKGSYNMNTAAVPNNNIDLKTGNWNLLQSILGNTSGRDRFNSPGLQSIRMQQNLSTSAFVQMNFDLTNGASKVTLWHGAYYTDQVSTWRLEYSTDSGLTWQQAVAVGRTVANVVAVSGGSTQETYLFNINGKVRFRVNKLGLGTTSVPNILNGRLCIEDIAVYSN